MERAGCSYYSIKLKKEDTDNFEGALATLPVVGARFHAAKARTYNNITRLKWTDSLLRCLEYKDEVHWARNRISSCLGEIEENRETPVDDDEAIVAVDYKVDQGKGPVKAG